jgi:hypothetical protein
MKSVLEHAFLDKVVPPIHDDGRVTKGEVAVMLGRQAIKPVHRNIDKLTEVSKGQLYLWSGSYALHLYRQLQKKSSDKFTECEKKLIIHSRNLFLVRAYKFVDADYFKVEVTMAKPAEREYLLLRPLVEDSVRLLERIVGGASSWLLPSYMHRKDFTPVTDVLRRVSL